MKDSSRICDLECLKDTSNVHEFNGPVKIILVDPPEDQYTKKNTGAAFIALANMMLGANIVLVLLFTLGFKLPIYNNLHIMLCTLGYKFCMPVGILMLHSLNGASASMKKTERRLEHILIHIVGLSLALAGTYLVWKYGEDPVISLISKDRGTSFHYKSGMAAAILCGLCVLTGPLIFLRKSELVTPSWLTAIHRLFGILAFVVATVCFIFGIIKPTFQIWLFIMAYMSPTYFLVFFTVFYTAVVLTTPMKNMKTTIFASFRK